MIVNVVECLDGARKAKGLVVVVDVFRAFSVACYVVDNGVSELLAVDNMDLARVVSKNQGGLLVGEQAGVMVDGCDYGNSPTAVKDVDFSGKTIVLSTDAGTKGLFACGQADEVITASFVNAKAVIDYIKEAEPEIVTLVAIGTDGNMRAQEDMMCAMYIKNELEDYPNSYETLNKFLSKVDSSQAFFDDENEEVPEEDFALCMDLDRFDFVLRCAPGHGGSVRLEKIKA